MDLTLDLDELAGYFGSMADRLRDVDFTKPLQTAKGLINDDTRQNFLAQQTPDGEPWKELNPVYALEKQRIIRRIPRPHYPGFDGILILSGTMFSSITGVDTGFEIDEMTRKSLEIGTTKVYAIYHQYGTRKIPKREFLGIRGGTSDRIADFFGDHVVRLILEGDQ